MFALRKFAISQSEAVSYIIWLSHLPHLLTVGYSKYLIVRFLYASAAYDMHHGGLTKLWLSHLSHLLIVANSKYLIVRFLCASVAHNSHLGRLDQNRLIRKGTIR